MLQHQRERSRRSSAQLVTRPQTSHPLLKAWVGHVPSGQPGSSQGSYVLLGTCKEKRLNLIRDRAGTFSWVRLCRCKTKTLPAFHVLIDVLSSCHVLPRSVFHPTLRVSPSSRFVHVQVWQSFRERDGLDSFWLLASKGDPRSSEHWPPRPPCHRCKLAQPGRRV